MSIYTIDGNIGSGKSTLIDMLRNEYIVIDEPVTEWKKIVDEEGKNIITKFYNNIERWAFPFQMMAYISRLAKFREMLRKYPNAVLLSERSTFTDFNVFAKMLHHSGKISKIEYTIYCKWFDEFMREIPIKGFIYLTTPPEVCLERIKKRGRGGEENITLEYLTTCHQYHENWLKDEKNVLIIEDQNCQKIKEFINTPSDININKYIEKNDGLFISY